MGNAHAVENLLWMEKLMNAAHTLQPNVKLVDMLPVTNLAK